MTAMTYQAAGQVANTYEYAAFGPVLSQRESLPNPFTYTGEWCDPETGLLYLRARYLDMEAGRFLSIDSLGLDLNVPNSIHRYVYVFNDPIDHWDPTGQQTLVNFVVTGAIIGILSGAAAYTLVHPPGSKQFTWKGLVLWSAVGGVTGAAAGYGAWYVWINWGPLIAIETGGGTSYVARRLVDRWPRADILLRHYNEHVDDFTNLIGYRMDIEEYAARSHAVTQRYMVMRTKIHSQWSYVKYYLRPLIEKGGKIYYEFVVEKGGKIVSYRPLRKISELKEFFAGLIR